MASRRSFLSAAAGGALSISGSASAAEFDSRRPAPEKRRFTSEAVEAVIRETKKAIADPEIAWLFENCYPNTLDTTVEYSEVDGQPDTFVITGDIHAMWLRDSTAQVWPYVPLAKKLDHYTHISGRPILIGEFTACAPGRGLQGLFYWVHKVKDQAERGRAYRYYVENAAAHPAMIGTHWFQLVDDLPTGRPSDQERLNYGFLNVLDLPYAELV
ncbi:MAG: glycoside hydrolase family 125 protein, partial [Acidobacteria bacterium]|nr:glycoside hydrolase family 125 protein [Acidobacteriota bacterium]